MFFFSSRRRHTRFSRDWSSDVCSSDLEMGELLDEGIVFQRGRPAFADRTQALVVLDRMALARGECFALISHGLPLFKGLRSEERRVGKECISRCSLYH